MNDAIIDTAKAHVNNAREETARLVECFDLPSMAVLRQSLVNADAALSLAAVMADTDPERAGVALGAASVALLMVISSSRTTAADRRAAGRILRIVASAEGLIEAVCLTWHNPACLLEAGHEGECFTA